MAAKQRSPALDALPEFPELCRSMAELSPQPMVAVEGKKHLVRYVNPAFRRLLGGVDRHLIGRPFAEAVPEGMANGCAPLLDRVFATGVPESLPEQEHGSGLVGGEIEREALPTHWSYLAWAILAPAGSEGRVPVGVMIQVTDASEIAEFRTRTVAINEALLQSGLRMHELMEESRRLSAGLLESAAQERDARREAQDANHSKDIFLATLSHEMRTPLNAILGWAVLLRMQRARTGQPLDADLDQGLAVIERNARGQGRLIEDVLDVARVVSGKFQLNLQQCDLDAIAFAATATMRPAASARGIALNVFVEPAESLGSFKLMADAARLHQAVLNLLSNAVKFSSPGGEVRVGLERDGERGMARVVVSDSGKGIKADFLPLIFDRFTQAAEGSTRSFGGLGLGLTIVRHIAELHGGTVVAYSEGEGRGATFTLELPAQMPLPTLDTHANLLTQSDVAELLRTVSYVPAFRLDDLRVLVVDDEEDARTVAQRALESAGATVFTAASAEEGFQFAIQTNAPPHVLVSDVAMPGEDGYSLIRRLRSAGANAGQLPAVALTAYAGADERTRALSEGFQVHLPKPLDLQELIAAVGTLAGRSRV